MQRIFRVFIPSTTSVEAIYKPFGNVFYLTEPPVSLYDVPCREDRRVRAIVSDATKRSDRSDLVYFDHHVTPAKLGDELNIGVINEFEAGDNRFITVFSEESMRRALRGKDYGMLPHLMERLHTFGSGRVYTADYPVGEVFLESGLMVLLGCRLNGDEMEKRLRGRLKSVVNGSFAVSIETLMEEFKVAEDNSMKS